MKEQCFKVPRRPPTFPYLTLIGHSIDMEYWKPLREIENFSYKLNLINFTNFHSTSNLHSMGLYITEKSEVASENLKADNRIQSLTNIYI